MLMEMLNKQDQSFGIIITLVVLRAHREEPQILCSPFVTLLSLGVRQAELFLIFFVELFSDKRDRIFYLVYPNVKRMTIGKTIQKCSENPQQRKDGQGTTAQFFTIKAIYFGLDIFMKNCVRKVVHIHSNRKAVAAVARDDKLKMFTWDYE
jgi:hypothetical protein